MARRPPPDEFEIIRRYFVPLAKGHPGARGLTDDVATLALAPGRELVITADAIVAGVHFLPGDPADAIARKMLRVNLSDLAAKGAVAIGYLMTIAAPASIGEDWLESFARGLAADQAEFGVTLLGGDTTATPGPLTLSVTAVGEIAAGATLHRDGAKAGDAVFVSGTLGDGALGLAVARGGLTNLPESLRNALLDRYRVPRPRMTLGPRLIGIAHAALDVSDGLVADLGHICECSGLRAVVDAASVPLSEAAARALAEDGSLRSRILAGGDDYEILFTAPEDSAAALARLAGELEVPITRIGRMVEGTGVTVLDSQGRPIPLSHEGYRHFAGPG
ncbi:MAG: thiamine-phosphate kinase [Alphaproteobacteria bacterium]